jgi:hypothetical protein
MKILPLENIGPLTWVGYVLIAVMCYSIMVITGHGLYVFWDLFKKGVKETGGGASGSAGLPWRSWVQSRH